MPQQNKLQVAPRACSPRRTSSVIKNRLLRVQSVAVCLALWVVRHKASPPRKSLLPPKKPRHMSTNSALKKTLRVRSLQKSLLSMMHRLQMIALNVKMILVKHLQVCLSTANAKLSCKHCKLVWKKCGPRKDTPQKLAFKPRLPRWKRIALSC